MNIVSCLFVLCYLCFLNAQKQVILPIPSFSRPYKLESDEIKQKNIKSVQRSIRKRWAQIVNINVQFLNTGDSEIFKHMPCVNNMAILADFSKRPLSYLFSLGSLKIKTTFTM